MFTQLQFDTMAFAGCHQIPDKVITAQAYSWRRNFKFQQQVTQENR